MTDSSENERISLVANHLSQYISSEYNPGNVDFNILSTIRYDPNITKLPPLTVEDISMVNFFLLDEHYHRLLYTLRYFTAQEGQELQFEVTKEFLFEKLVDAIKASDLQVFQPMKVRLLVSLKGEITIELYEIPYRQNLLDGIVDSNISEPVVWDVRVDSKETLISPFTSFKTTHRAVYTDARERGIPGINPGREEVLLVNTLGQLMEGSITNVAVKRVSDGVWVTPVLTSGCLCGVMRNYLIREGYVEEDVIRALDVTPGSDVLLFNGIMGVVKGKVVERT